MVTTEPKENIMDNHFSNAERAEVLTQALPYIKKHTNEKIKAKNVTPLEILQEGGYRSV